jgi:hypothetical protein
MLKFNGSMVDYYAITLTGIDFIGAQVDTTGLRFSVQQGTSIQQRMFIINLID